MIYDEYDRKEMETIFWDKLRAGCVCYDDRKGLVVCIPESVLPHALKFLKEVIENRYWLNLEDYTNRCEDIENDGERIFKFKCIKIPIGKY